MNKVNKLYDYTDKLINVLEDGAKLGRDEKIKKIQVLLEKRKNEISLLSAPFSEEEMELGKTIISMNQKLDLLLKNEKLMIQQDIQELHTKKEWNKKHVNPYESLLSSGVFYDKRK